MPANSAWERGGIIRRGGYVMSHRLTVTSLSVCVWGNRCATFEQGARSFPTSVFGGMRMCLVMGRHFERNGSSKNAEDGKDGGRNL
jgi:hypothetical protein